MASSGREFSYGLIAGMVIMMGVATATAFANGGTLPYPFGPSDARYSDSRSEPEETEPEKPAPVTIKSGQEFKVGTYTVLKGWRIHGISLDAYDPFTGDKVDFQSAALTSKVRNDQPGSVGGVDFHLYLMRTDGTEAASIFCYGDQMAGGETLPLACDSNRDDWPAKYDRIELETD